ncbi:MAG TPA: hypothetical protein VFQ06_04005 [Nitrospira sp.]|nr:hypothetical protein [Nitrospira sp.]
MPFLAPSLDVLRSEINKVAPSRDKASDGWIGDDAHCPGTSDHCADPDGMVHAIDVDKDFNSPYLTANKLVRTLIGDWRLQYVIWNRTIWSTTWGWTSRRYEGPNPHTAHIHVSGRKTMAAELSSAPWGVLDFLPPPMPPVLTPLIVASSEDVMPYLLVKHADRPEVFALFASGLVRHIGPAEYELYTSNEEVSVPLATTQDQAEYTRLVEAALALRK